MKQLPALLIAFAIFLNAVWGCRSGGQKLHLVESSPYVNARTGQLIEEDRSDDGWFDGLWDALFDAIWDSIFRSSENES